MTLTYDPEADAIYVYLTSEDASPTDQVELDDRRTVDYDDSGEAVGVELLSVSQGVDLAGLPRAEEIAALLRGLTGLQVAAA